jgi:hypothetical protein
MQTISWGQLVGEVGVLLDPCGDGALYGFEVYLTGLDTRSGPALKGFLVNKKKEKKKKGGRSHQRMLCMLRVSWK